MDRNKFAVILDRLSERPSSAALRWKCTSDPDAFLLVLKDSSISVSRVYGFDEESGEEESVYFNFRNENGESVESEEASRFRGQKDPLFERALQIYYSARNEALKIDETVDRIIEQLAA